MGNLKSGIAEFLLECPAIPGVLGAVEVPDARPKLLCLVGGKE